MKKFLKMLGLVLVPMFVVMAGVLFSGCTANLTIADVEGLDDRLVTVEKEIQSNEYSGFQIQQTWYESTSVTEGDETTTTSEYKQYLRSIMGMIGFTVNENEIVMHVLVPIGETTEYEVEDYRFSFKDEIYPTLYGTAKFLEVSEDNTGDFAVLGNTSIFDNGSFNFVPGAVVIQNDSLYFCRRSTTENFVEEVTQVGQNDGEASFQNYIWANRVVK